MRILSTLLKKLASKGFRGDSFKRKLYSFISKDSSSPSLSLICETSEVSSSQDMFGYLQKKEKKCAYNHSHSYFKEIHIQSEPNGASNKKNLSSMIALH